MHFQIDSSWPSGRRPRFVSALLLLLLTVAIACGRDEAASPPPGELAAPEAPGTAPAVTPAASPGSQGAEAAPPTAAEIETLARRIGVGDPVARALLVATLPLHATPSERDERLVELAGELAVLESELQAEVGAGEVERAYADPAVIALRAGDFAAARSTLAEASERIEADATSSDPVGIERRVTLHAQAGRIALLQGRNSEAVGIFEQASAGILPNQTLLQAELLGLLGLAQLRGGQLAEARESLEQSVRLRKGRQGNEHPDVAAAFERLADCYRAQGEYGKAEILYRRALGIWQKGGAARASEVSRVEARIEAMQPQQGVSSTNPPAG